MSPSPVGVLLAAGHSRRFNGNKLLHNLGENNRPMLFVTAQKLLNVLPVCITVINHTLEPYVAELEAIGMRVVINEQSQRGMGSSIACGIGAARDASGWLIALADMPYIETSTLQQLIQGLNDGADIVAPLYQQHRGNPVGFNHRYRDELLALNDEIGAREIITRHKNRLELIPCNDQGVITDIDEPGDCI
jgi:molybdenum cofactor cytidylyltransferase